MSDERGEKVLRLASGIAAGAYTASEVSEFLGDGSMMEEVLETVAGIAAGAVVAGPVYDIAKETPVVGDIVDLGEDIVGGAFGLLDDIF